MTFDIESFGSESLVYQCLCGGEKNIWFPPKTRGSTECPSIEKSDPRYIELLDLRRKTPYQEILNLKIHLDSNRVNK